MQKKVILLVHSPANLNSLLSTKMSSLAPSSSVSPSLLPSFTPTLAHSLNSRGELGMFVNPYGCSCTTCRDYIAERAPDAPALDHEEPRGGDGDGEGSSFVPPLARTYTNGGANLFTGLSNTTPLDRVAEPAVLPTRSLGGGIGLLRDAPGLSVSFADSLPALGRSTGAYSSTFLGRSSTVYVDGWGGEERPIGGGLGAGTSLAPSSSSPFVFPRLPNIADDDEFCDTLRSYRSTLQLQSSEGMSDDELAEREEKIRAIEHCLLAFRSFFRTG